MSWRGHRDILSLVASQNPRAAAAIGRASRAGRNAGAARAAAAAAAALKFGRRWRGGVPREAIEEVHRLFMAGTSRFDQVARSMGWTVGGGGYARKWFGNRRFQFSVIYPDYAWNPFSLSVYDPQTETSYLASVDESGRMVVDRSALGAWARVRGADTMRKVRVAMSSLERELQALRWQRRPDVTPGPGRRAFLANASTMMNAERPTRRASLANASTTMNTGRPVRRNRLANASMMMSSRRY